MDFQKELWTSNTNDVAQIIEKVLANVQALKLPKISNDSKTKRG